MEDKRKITLTIIGVSTLLILVLSATFAYFSAQTSNDKGTTNVTASTETVGSIALSNPTGDLHLNLSVSDMAQDNLNTYWATDNESKNYDSEEVQREIAVAELSGGSATAKYECTTTISVELSDTMASKLQPEDGYIQFGELLTDKIDLTSISADGYQVTFKLDGTNVKRQRVTAAIALVNRNNDQSYIAGEKLGITFSNSDLECKVVSKTNLSETIMALSEVDGSGVYHEMAKGTYNVIVPAAETAWTSVDITEGIEYEAEAFEFDPKPVFTPNGDSGIWGIFIDYAGIDGDHATSSGTLNLVPLKNENYILEVSVSSINAHIQINGTNVSVSEEQCIYDSEVDNLSLYNGGISSSNATCTIDLGYLTTEDKISIDVATMEISYGSGSLKFYYKDPTEIDAGYRYEGAEVNNYITFNDETWRIIGVEEGSAIGLTEGQYYTKLIRSESFETNMYVEPEFVVLLIDNILNGAYYNKTILEAQGDEIEGPYYPSVDYSSVGLTEESKTLLVKPKWYGIDYSSLSTSKETYVTEKKEGWTSSAYVGLMSSSDYGYGALQSECANVDLKNYSSCNSWLSTDKAEWLYSGSEGYGDDRVYGLKINDSRSIEETYADDTFSYRPVVYLKSDVVITGGNGGIDSKYEIALSE